MSESGTHLEQDRRDERTTLYAALAFGGFTDAEETKRVTLWAAEEIQRLEAERDRLRSTIERALNLTSDFDREHYGREQHLIGNIQAREMLQRALNG